MRLAVLAVCVMAFALMAPASSYSAAAPPRWQDARETFVVLRDQAPGGMRAFVRALEDAGGHVAVVHSPNAAVVFADDAALAAPAVRAAVALATGGRIADPAALSHGADAARVWNASLELASAPPEPAGASRAVDVPGVRGPDAGPVPMEVMHGAAPEGAAVSDHMPDGADYYDTSAYLAGSVAVGVWLLEPPVSAVNYHWTSAHETESIAGVQAGLANWVRKGGPPTFLTFYLDVHTKVTVSSAPILSPMSSQGVFVNQALTAAGWPGADGIQKCFAYNNAIRDTFDTNWAYSIFIAESDPSNNQGLFSSGGYAWGYFGGPWVYMSRFSTWAYGAGSYFAGVPMHETGHIFFDTDEYDGLRQYGGYLNESDDPNYPQCIMNMNDTTTVCPATRNQLGWRDNNGNGIIDVLDSPPACQLVPIAPDTTSDPTPTWTGNAQVTAVPNQSLNSRYNPPHAITVATIAGVEVRVDGGAWLPASALDGTFDDYAEGFTWTAPPLANGTHMIEARGRSSVGNLTVALASDEVTVNSTVAVEPGLVGPFRLEAPRPNPARGSAELRFVLPRSGRVNLDVLDVSGRRVATVLDARRCDAGATSATWDGRDDAGMPVRAGVYVARVTLEGETRTRTIVVTR